MRSSNGMRQEMRKLTNDEITHLKSEIRAIEADESVFVFDDALQTSYTDKDDFISIATDVFPDLTSDIPRDLMSERAVLAHEYYGHRAFRGTTVPPRSWNDEFRASYTAAKNAPNLTDKDRQFLVRDALARATEKGVKIKHNSFIRRILYGYPNID